MPVSDHIVYEQQLAGGDASLARIIANGVRFLTPKSAGGTLDGQQVTAIDQTEGGEPEAEAPAVGTDAEADVDF